MRLIIISAILLVVAMLALGFFFTKPASPEMIWLREQAQRCNAMRSRLNYDEQAKIATCYRTPFMRHPKLVFEEVFQEAK